MTDPLRLGEAPGGSPRREIEKTVPVLTACLDGSRDLATPTTPRILESFDDAEWHEYVEGDRTVSFPVQLKQAALQLLDLADAPRSFYDGADPARLSRATIPKSRSRKVRNVGRNTA